jgi:hypothetical protein
MTSVQLTPAQIETLKKHMAVPTGPKRIPTQEVVKWLHKDYLARAYGAAMQPSFRRRLLQGVSSMAVAQEEQLRKWWEGQLERIRN